MEFETLIKKVVSMLGIQTTQITAPVPGKAGLVKFSNKDDSELFAITIRQSGIDVVTTDRRGHFCAFIG